jgi:arginyl-tRNA synthetase
MSMAERTETANKPSGLTYRGHPLRRVDNLIYYGTMAEKYIILIQVLDSKKIKDLSVATKVSIQLQLTDPDLKSRDRVVKKSEKESLYAAMDVSAIWLERALAGKL